MRILLVDDDIHSLDPLAKLLRLGGFDVVPTNLATRAVTLLSTQRFDVVITDLEMPDVGGGVLLKVARACQREARLIAISGSVGRDAVSTSDVTFLAKPIDLDELLAVIRPPRGRRRPTSCAPTMGVAWTPRCSRCACWARASSRGCSWLMRRGGSS